MASHSSDSTKLPSTSHRESRPSFTAQTSTFKYVLGSTTYDQKRAPAYTDRIVYSIPPTAAHSPPTNVKCERYSSHEIFWSDHRPVSATFTIDVRVKDDGKRREEYLAVQNELGKLEEVYRPALDIEASNLEFGDVKFGDTVVREIVLRNKGRVPAMFNFKAPSSDKPICALSAFSPNMPLTPGKEPIWPFPCTGTVEAGQTMTLKVTLSVDVSWTRRLSLAEEDLNGESTVTDATRTAHTRCSCPLCIWR